MSKHYKIHLRGGTCLLLPAGRGPDCHYDRLMALLNECQVRVEFFPAGKGWRPGADAVVGAEVVNEEDTP